MGTNRSETYKSEIRNQKLEIRNRKSEIRNLSGFAALAARIRRGLGGGPHRACGDAEDARGAAEAAVAEGAAEGVDADGGGEVDEEEEAGQGDGEARDGVEQQVQRLPQPAQLRRGAARRARGGARPRGSLPNCIGAVRAPGALPDPRGILPAPCGASAALPQGFPGAELQSHLFPPLPLAFLLFLCLCLPPAPPSLLPSIRPPPLPLLLHFSFPPQITPFFSLPSHLSHERVISVTRKSLLRVSSKQHLPQIPPSRVFIVLKTNQNKSKLFTAPPWRARGAGGGPGRSGRPSGWPRPR